MIRKSTWLILLIGLAISTTAHAAERYKLDAAHSSIGFSVKHLVISNTKGEFNKFDGEVYFDEEDITNSSVNVTINTASIDTDDEKRDNHLKSNDFLNVEKYPKITFKSTQVKKVGDNHVLVGDLTIRDVTKEVEVPFTLTGPIEAFGGKRLGVEADLTINRHDYNVSWSKTLDNGGLVVGNDVKIDIELEAIRDTSGTN